MEDEKMINKRAKRIFLEISAKAIEISLLSMAGVAGLYIAFMFALYAMIHDWEGASTISIILVVFTLILLGIGWATYQMAKAQAKFESDMKSIVDDYVEQVKKMKERGLIK